jgi:hypothetical protein
MQRQSRVLLGCAAGVLVFASASPAAVILHNRLDAINGNQVPSAVGPAGTIDGTPNVATGKLGNSVNLKGGMPGPGDDMIQIGQVLNSLPGFNGTGPRTVSGWVNANDNVSPNWASPFGFTNNASGDPANTGTFFDVSIETPGGGTARYRPHQWGSEQSRS